MPLMYPLVSVWNLTPTSIAEPSLAFGTAGAAVLGQIVHGHVIVVKVHVYDPDIEWPALSVAPLTVAVNLVPWASAAVGVNDAVLVVLFQETVPATEALLASTRVNLIDDGTTAS